MQEPLISGLEVLVDQIRRLVPDCGDSQWKPDVQRWAALSYMVEPREDGIARNLEVLINPREAVRRQGPALRVGLPSAAWVPSV